MIIAESEQPAVFNQSKPSQMTLFSTVGGLLVWPPPTPFLLPSCLVGCSHTFIVWSPITDRQRVSELVLRVGALGESSCESVIWLRLLSRLITFDLLYFVFIQKKSCAKKHLSKLSFFHSEKTMADEVILGNQELTNNFNAIQAKDQTINWFAFVRGADSWDAAGHGSGGLSEVARNLSQDQIQYVVIRVEAVDVEYGVHTSRPKVILVTWVGSNVSGINRRKILGQKEEVRGSLKGVSIHVDIDDIDAFDLPHIGQILMASQGAHKPAYYKFGAAQWDLPAHA